MYPECFMFAYIYAFLVTIYNFWKEYFFTLVFIYLDKDNREHIHFIIRKMF